MFISLQTSIGYFEIDVHLKTPLKENEDFQCSFFIDESRSDAEIAGKPLSIDGKKTCEKMLCGPTLFSSVMSENKMTGLFTIYSAELMKRKSLYVIAKLEQVKQDILKPKDTLETPKDELSESSPNKVTGEGASQTKTFRPESGTKSPTELLIGDILKDVYVGVYQFKAISSNPFYFPGCREVMLQDGEFQENLLLQYLELVKDNCDLRDDGDIKKILKVFSWITSVYTCLDDKSL